MSSSSESNYNIQTSKSSVAKIVVTALLLLCPFLLFLLWGVGWFSAFLLIVYLIFTALFVDSLTLRPFQCSVTNKGNIKVITPIQITGRINARSFYNGWILFLCVEASDKLFIGKKHNKQRKWFVVFSDSVTENEYRLLARLINNPP